MSDIPLIEKEEMGFVPSERNIPHEHFFWRKDIKESIRKLKEEFDVDYPLNSEYVLQKIDKIFGVLE